MHCSLSRSAAQNEKGTGTWITVAAAALREELLSLLRRNERKTEFAVTFVFAMAGTF